jgi:hypothetical protein
MGGMAASLLNAEASYFNRLFVAFLIFSSNIVGKQRTESVYSLFPNTIPAHSILCCNLLYLIIPLLLHIDVTVQKAMDSIRIYYLL